MEIPPRCLWLELVEDDAPGVVGVASGVGSLMGSISGCLGNFSVDFRRSSVVWTRLWLGDTENLKNSEETLWVEDLMIYTTTVPCVAF